MSRPKRLENEQKVALGISVERWIVNSFRAHCKENYINGSALVQDMIKKYLIEKGAIKVDDE